MRLSTEGVKHTWSQQPCIYNLYVDPEHQQVIWLVYFESKSESPHMEIVGVLLTLLSHPFRALSSLRVERIFYRLLSTRSLLLLTRLECIFLHSVT